MDLIRNYLKQNYHLSSYQIAQIIFLFKTLSSELSKIVIMGILFHNCLGHYIFALFIMLCLRSITGGLHFYTYIGCLFTSILYLWSVLFPLSAINLTQYVKLTLLLVCILSCYMCGPIVSKYRSDFSEHYCKTSKKIVVSFIFFYTLLMYIIPENSFINTGFWVIILHSLQLIAAKIRKKGVALK